MSSAPHIKRFEGTDWEECHGFIIAIRARALWEGKQRDSAWIADFAAPLFWRKALTWHGRLPLDVRQDWIKLEAALFKQWPSPVDDDMPQIHPTPATALSLNHEEGANRPLRGVLKVVVDGSNANYYVKPPQPTICHLSDDSDEALRVRCNSLSRATLLERIDHLCDSWLAVHWAHGEADTEAGSPDYAQVTCVNLDTLTSSWTENGPFQPLTCTVSRNGEVIPVWKDGTRREDEYLYLVADPEAYSQRYCDEDRAKLFIEPTD